MQVYDAKLEGGDFEAIKQFIIDDANGPVPELSESGNRVLDGLTTKNYLWNPVLARLVRLVPTGQQHEIIPGVWRPVYIDYDTGNLTTRAYTYYHEEEPGKVTIAPVQVDESNPEFADGVYIVGTSI